MVKSYGTFKHTQCLRIAILLQIFAYKSCHNSPLGAPNKKILHQILTMEIGETHIWARNDAGVVQTSDWQSERQLYLQTLRYFGHHRVLQVSTNFHYCFCLGKPQEIVFLVAQPLRVGGGGWPLKKRTFLETLFFILVPIVNKTYCILRFS